jgi:hypothetical protein
MLARNPLSLTTLIAWLQTKNPAEFYAFSDLCGKCLFSQYLTSMGFIPEPTSEYTFDTWRALHLYFGPHRVAADQDTPKLSQVILLSQE